MRRTGPLFLVVISAVSFLSCTEHGPMAPAEVWSPPYLDLTGVPGIEWRETDFPDFTGQGSVGELAIDPDNRIYAGVSSGNVSPDGPGVWRSSDATGDGTWEQLIEGLTSTNAGPVGITQSGEVFAGTFAAGVFRLDRDRDVWEPTALNTGPITHIVTSGETVYALDGFSCRGVFRSTDGGRTLTTINSGLATCVNALAVGAGGILFAATGTNGVYRSNSEPPSWQPSNSGLTVLNTGALALSAAGDVFVGTAGGGVFHMLATESSWTQLDSELSGLDVRSLEFNAAGHLFAATNAGVFRSTDNGGTWEPLNAGLDPVPNGVGDFVFQSTGHAVTTNGLKVWRTIGSTVDALMFPLRDDNGRRGDPYTWPVTAAFDHQMPLAAFCPDVNSMGGVTAVVSFTGETGDNADGREGDGNPGVPGVRLRPRTNSRICPAGPPLQGYPNASGTGFFSGADGINGTPDDAINYTGGQTGFFTLGYDGHPGYDYSASFEPVYAAADGRVIIVERCKVEIEHAGGYSTVYEHLDDVHVAVYQTVVSGQLIATSGDCDTEGAPHLHFGVKLTRADGTTFEVDPYGWVGNGRDPYEDRPIYDQNFFVTGTWGVPNVRLWQ